MLLHRQLLQIGWVVFGVATLLACNGGGGGGGSSEDALNIDDALVPESILYLPECVEIIGFSQTLQMFNIDDSGFEVAVDAGDNIQLFASGGLTLNTWEVDGSAYTRASTSSDCVDAGDAPQLGVFSVSGSFGDDVALWVDGITLAVEGLVAHKPGLELIVLESVIGGPEGGICESIDIQPSDSGDCDGDDFGDVVRASEQYPFIVEAINQVIDRTTWEGVTLRAGVFPTVPSCQSFCDSKGHLHPDVRYAVGESVGALYVERNTLLMAED